LNLSNEQISINFQEWQTEELKNYLFEITSKLVKLKNSNDEYVLDTILDKSSQKGTGKNSVIASFDYNVPVSPIVEAVNARLLSSFYDNREKYNSFLDSSTIDILDTNSVEDVLYDGIYLAIFLSYINGLELIKESSCVNGWDIDLANIVKVWKSGCIIQSNVLYFLEDIIKEYDYKDNLLTNELVLKEINKRAKSLRKLVLCGVSNGIPVSVVYSILSMVDTLNSKVLPANLIQIQRDYFGYHGFEKTNKDGKIYHLDENL
jgi:6-phosphogluconate dehydrogenase